MFLENFRTDIVEFSKTLAWYSHKKATIIGSHLEGGKGIIVDILKARRGTYQKPFLHVGMVFLTIFGFISAPLIVNQYPTSASSGQVLSATAPSAVLNTQADPSTIETITKESNKPRRDVISYTVQGGDTLSGVAKKFSLTDAPIDAESIAYLNNFSVEKTLKPGDVIKIPPISGVVITVKSGDTIETLAKKYGLGSSQAIVDWPYNEFANDEKYTLIAGQTLVLPGGKAPEEVPVYSPKIVNAPTLFAGGSGKFVWPTTGIITQYFAWYHTADDIANGIGTPIVAADSGRVTSVLYQNFGYGYHVIIDHGNGYRTLYGHLSKIDVSEGQNVGRGERIGAMGSTGRSTGSHLHFEVYLGGTRINPLSVLK